MASAQSRFLIRAIRCYLILSALLMCASSGNAQGFDPTKQFPVTVSAEAFNSRPTVVTVSVVVFFPVDEKRYVPVSESLAQILSFPPEVISKPGLSARVIETVCTPQEIPVPVGGDIGFVKGGTIKCDVEITPSKSAARGTYQVTLLFSMVDLVYERVNSRAPASRAVAYVRVDVWPSVEAKNEVLRIAEEQKRRKEEVAAQQRREQEEAAARQRRESEEIAAREQYQREQAEALERHEARIRLLKNAVPFLAGALILGVLLFRYRKWIWPELKIVVDAGQHVQRHHALHAIGSQRNTEPGMILETMWAKSLFGSRRRIKIETLVSENSGTGRPDPLDVLISVGASVHQGTYLASGVNGAVRITVMS